MSPQRGRPQKPKDTVATLLRLVGQLRPEWHRVIVVGLLNVLSVVLLAVAPLLLGKGVNLIYYGYISNNLPKARSTAQSVAGLRANGKGSLANLVAADHIVPGAGVDITQLGQVLLLAIAAFLLASALNAAQGYVMSGVSLRTVFRIRESAEQKLARMPLRYFDSHAHGDTLSRITNDVDNISTTVQQALSQLFSAVITIVGLLVVMLVVSPLLTVIALVGVPATLALTIFIAHRSKPRFQAQWKRTGALNGLIEETYTGHALVLASGQREMMIEEFNRQNKQLYEASFSAQFSSVIAPTVQIVGNFSYVLVAVLGGYEVATAAVSLGVVQAFIQYTRRLTIPVTQIAGLVNQVESGLASAERVFEFLDESEEPELPGHAALANGAAVAKRAGHRLQFEGACFKYDPDNPLIEDFTLDAAPGHTIAIVGPSGAGKTTIVNLLMRFYEIDQGRILLDGIDYQDLSREEVRSRFGMVLQDAWLFTGTIRANIAYGKLGASDEEIVEAAKAADIDAFVRMLPDGYDTVLEEEAASLSAGQKQLLTIARVFLADPGILILDEATSNVDTQTEADVQAAMARLRADRTSFVIAHRLSTIRDADTIVVMESGRIREQGSHEELLARQGFYRQLYDDQFSAAS